MGFLCITMGSSLFNMGFPWLPKPRVDDISWTSLDEKQKCYQLNTEVKKINVTLFCSDWCVNHKSQHQKTIDGRLMGTSENKHEPARTNMNQREQKGTSEYQWARINLKP